jgi:hypothetical protein
MGKVLNIFFGIGTAVLVFVVIVLGIHTFYQEKTWDESNCTYPIAKEISSDLQGCTTNMTVGQCLDYRSNRSAEIISDQTKYDECNSKFTAEMKAYNKNLFIIASILGALAIFLGIMFIPLTNISAGVGFAGLALIIYAFTRGWGSTGDALKFIVAIIVAALVIWLGVRFSKRK